MGKQIGVVIDPLELDEKWVQRALEGGISLLGLHPNPKDSSPEQMESWCREPENRRLPSKSSIFVSGVISWAM